MKTGFVNTKYIIIGLLFAWLITSIGIKARRYLVSHVDDNQHLAQILLPVLNKQGWNAIEQQASDKYQALNIYRFEQKACLKPLQITFLNFGEATKQALSNAFGSDLLFIYDGKIVNTPPTDKQRSRSLVSSFKSMFSLRAQREIPIIVVTDFHGVAGCDVNLVDDWSRVSAEFSGLVK